MGEPTADPADITIPARDGYPLAATVFGSQVAGMYDRPEVGLDAIGHPGYFRPASTVLWADTIGWLDRL